MNDTTFQPVRVRFFHEALTTGLNQEQPLAAAQIVRFAARRQHTSLLYACARTIADLVDEQGRDPNQLAIWLQAELLARRHNPRTCMSLMWLNKMLTGEYLQAQNLLDQMARRRLLKPNASALLDFTAGYAAGSPRL